MKNKFENEEQRNLDFTNEELFEALQVVEEQQEKDPLQLVQIEPLILEGFLSMTVGADHILLPFEMLEEFQEKLKVAVEKVEEHFKEFEETCENFIEASNTVYKIIKE